MIRLPYISSVLVDKFNYLPHIQIFFLRTPTLILYQIIVVGLVQAFKKHFLCQAKSLDFFLLNVRRVSLQLYSRFLSDHSGRSCSSLKNKTKNKSFFRQAKSLDFLFLLNVRLVSLHLYSRLPLSALTHNMHKDLRNVLDKAAWRVRQRDWLLQ